MKRGKRQIVQKPIVFDGEDQSMPNQQLLSHFSTNNQHVHKPDNTQPIQHITHQQKEIKYQNVFQNLGEMARQPVIIQKPTTSKAQDFNTGSNDDQKKKRLQMLRQKYLKKGQTNSSQTNRQQKTQLNKIYPQKQALPVATSFKQLEKAQNKHENNKKLYSQKNKVEQSSNFFDSFAQSSSQSTHKQNQPVSPNYFLQNEMPISKPTQSVTSYNQNKISAPLPIPQSKRNKRQPPKPVVPVRSVIQPTTPQFNTSFQQENGSQKRKQVKSQIQDIRQDISQFNQQPQNNLTKNKAHQLTPNPKKVIPPKKKIPNNQNVEKQPQQLRQSSKSLHQSIQNWLTSSTSVDDVIKTYESENKISQLAKQISQNKEQHINNIVRKFMILNSTQYTEQQSNFVSDVLIINPNISELARVFFSIKCGLQALNNIQNETSPETLQQLMKLKSYLLQSQQKNYIIYYLQRFSGKQQRLPYLFWFCPTSPSIQQYILSYNFQNPINIVQLLTLIKKSIITNESLCGVYFKLINLLIQHVSDNILLQNILKLVNNINYASVYQMKKDIKLKIIQKIDRTDKTNQSARMDRQDPKVNYNNNRFQKDNEKDKGLGVGNLFGYVNQAFKIIKSQIPQKISTNPPPLEQQPKETITWDPVLGRYLINGKVPQNQSGSVFDSTNEQKQTKKKAPPPPPRPSKTKQSSKIEPNQQKSIIQPFQQRQSAQYSQNNSKYAQQINKVQQHQEQSNYSSMNPFPREQENQQVKSNARVPPPPPARMGIKGLANKKPKVTARYA